VKFPFFWDVEVRPSGGLETSGTNQPPTLPNERDLNCIAAEVQEHAEGFHKPLKRFAVIVRHLLRHLVGAGCLIEPLQVFCLHRTAMS